MKVKVKKAKSSYDLEYLPPKLDFIASTRRENATFRSKQRNLNFTNQFTFGWDSSCSSDNDNEDNEPTKLTKRIDEISQTSIKSSTSKEDCQTKQLKTAEKETNTISNTNKATQSCVKCFDNHKKGATTKKSTKIKTIQIKKNCNTSFCPEDVKFISHKKDKSTNTERGRTKIKNINLNRRSKSDLKLQSKSLLNTRSRSKGDCELKKPFFNYGGGNLNLYTGEKKSFNSNSFKTHDENKVEKKKSQSLTSITSKNLSHKKKKTKSAAWQTEYQRCFSQMSIHTEVPQSRSKQSF